MALTLSQNYTAVVPNANFVQFVASGGTPPYSYSVLPGGAGGSINSSNGDYVAPSAMTAYPATKLLDTIQVQDGLLSVTTAQILIGTPLLLLCDILENYLNLPNDHIYLWDQKIFQPTDSNLYVAVSVPSCKPFANNPSAFSSSLPSMLQTVSMYARVDIDAISRGPSARDQKELIPLALNSIYSQQQQEANGFYIGKLPVMGGFINLSGMDGAAIPYRFRISYAMQYVASFTSNVPYFDTFQTESIITNS